MNKGRSILEKYINRKAKAQRKFAMIEMTGENINNIDFFNLINRKNFEPACFTTIDRDERIKKVKADSDLNFLNKISTKSVIINKRMGEDKNTLVFSKVNPLSLSDTIRPHSLDWTSEQFNTRVVDRLVAEENEKIEKTQKIKQLNEVFEQETKKLENSKKL